MKVKIYLAKKTKLSESPMKKALYPYIKSIEYINNPKAADIIIDCEYINKDSIRERLKDILESVEKAIALKSKSVSPLQLE